jgi:hypothetical protein
MLLKNLSIAAVLAFCATVAPAQVVNLDIENTAGWTYSGQGAYADAGNDFWNSSLDGMTDLVESDGVTATMIDVTISAGSRHAFTLSHDLMADYSYSRDVDTAITISGLSPNGNYLLYVYCQGDQLSQNATVSFGGSSSSTTGLLDGTISEGGNYVVMAATANASGEITGTVARNGSNYAAVNGLQIIYTGQNTTPSTASNVINVDLGGSSTGTAGDGDNRSGTPFSGQGAYSDTGNDYWNNTLSTDNPTLSDLVASDGSTVTEIDVTVSGGGGYEDTGKSNYLLSDYFYGESTTVISGLNPEGSYTVYVYACGDQSGQGSDITVGGVTQSTSNSGDPDSYSLGVNYVVFETTADIIGRIIIAAGDKINGFQLIEGDPAQTGYEAEEAVFSGLSLVLEGNASGNFCLDGFDTEGDFVEYRNVDAGDTLIITYANETNTTRCSVYVDGVDAASAYFAATGSDAVFGSVTLSDLDISEGGSVRLQLDADDITFNGGQACAIQDKIDIETDGEVIVVSSIMELLAQLDKDNVNVKMTPGEYELTVADKEAWLIPTQIFFNFSGNNSTYDFSGVTINVDTDLFDEYGSVEIIIVTVTGDQNHIFGLTQKDVGDHLLSKNVLNFRVRGDYNTIEEVSLYTRSSYPYGYGDLFGKGSGAVISHRKHSAFLVNGANNHILNCFFDMKTYGHCFFMQGSINTLVEGLHIVGETRTTDEVLAEEGTGSPADDVDFMTVDGWRVPPGYKFSCQEDGIRCYNTGVMQDGTTRNTANTTVKNCTVEYARSGVTIGFSDGDNSVSGCTAIGVEGAFWPGNGDSVVDCQADAPHAAIINNPYANDGNQLYDITVLRETPVYGNVQMTYLAGSNHDVTLWNSGIQPRATIQTNQMGGLKRGMRYVELVEGRNDYDLSNSTLVNWTDQHVRLESNSSNCDVWSYGLISDAGSGNASTSISPATITASSASSDRYNIIDADTNTAWVASGAGEWIQIDLGATRNLYAVSIQWLEGGARSYMFDLETSDNASTWTTVYSGASLGVSAGFEAYDFETQLARYIRVRGHGNSVDDSIAIVDFEVDLKNRFAMVKTKSDAGSDYIAQHTLDGDLATRWAAEGDGQWIQYDLLHTQTVHAVSLAWHNGDSRTYSFDIMTSGHPMGPWTTVYSGDSSGTTLVLEEYEFTPVAARFIRVTGHGNSVDDWNNITEIFMNTGELEGILYNDWADDEGLSGFEVSVAGNPDADTLVNLVEYALGGDPLGGDGVEIHPFAVIPLDGTALEYTYRRRVDAAERGLSYVVKTTDDLTDPDSWTTAGMVEAEVTGLDEEFETVTITTAQGVQGFIRLEVQLD